MELLSAWRTRIILVFVFLAHLMLAHAADPVFCVCQPVNTTCCDIYTRDDTMMTCTEKLSQIAGFGVCKRPYYQAEFSLVAWKAEQTWYLPETDISLTVRFENLTNAPLGEWKSMNLEGIDSANGVRMNQSSSSYVLPSLTQFGRYPFNGENVLLFLAEETLRVSFCGKDVDLEFSMYPPPLLPRKVVALIVCGTLLGVAAIVILIVVLVRRRRSKRSYTSI